MYNYYNNLYEDKKIPSHKTFISFHHKDDAYKEEIETQCGNIKNGFISKSVSDGDINTDLSTDRIRQIIRDDFISTATVTVVLIGQDTWRRKYVDWEIGSSIRATKKNPRTGLIGLILPSYSVLYPYMTANLKSTENGGVYFPNTIPPRLYDNIECGFAKIYSWSNNTSDILKWIDEAYKSRDKILPDNSRPSFSNNRSDNNYCWSN